MKNKIVILCGKSGSGKDRIQKGLVENHGYTPIISWTSRPKRENETEGVEYHFCTKSEFEYMIENDKLIEHRKYNTLVNGNEDTWYYGVLKEKLETENENQKYVIILDLKGAKSFINYYGKANCECYFVFCDDKRRTERAKKRGSFDESEWNRRLKADEEDFSNDKLAEVINHGIFNISEDVNDAVSSIIKSMKKHNEE